MNFEELNIEIATLLGHDIGEKQEHLWSEPMHIGARYTSICKRCMKALSKDPKSSSKPCIVKPPDYSHDPQSSHELVLEMVKRYFRFRLVSPSEGTDCTWGAKFEPKGAHETLWTLHTPDEGSLTPDFEVIALGAHAALLRTKGV